MIRCDVGPLGRCIHVIGFGVGKNKSIWVAALI